MRAITFSDSDYRLLTMSSKATDAKLFFLLSFFGVTIYIILAFYTFHTAYIVSKVKKSQISKALFNLGPDPTEPLPQDDLKYILIYTRNVSDHSKSNFKEGRREFLNNMCPYTNCYLTHKENFLKKDISNFDAVVINVTDLNDIELPTSRSVRQKYVFYSTEPSDHTPICREDVENYFNWTWTYKLYSDILSPFFLVKDIKGEVVAPKHNVKWPRNVHINLNYNYYYLMKKNTKAAVATIVRNCNDKFGKIYSKKMRAALKKYDLTLDIIGCGKECKNATDGGCDNVIRNSYYFLLIQEKTLAEDYLTDKVLLAYFNGLVPIIKSGAQLHKFLPPGSYINAHHVTPDKIAAIVFYTIDNPEVYNAYFRWKESYSFHRRHGLEGICELCEHLNNKRWVNDYRTYDTFRGWWYNGPLNEMCGRNITYNLEL